MKLARFTRHNRTCLGRVDGERIIDLTAVVPDAGDSMRYLLEHFGDVRDAIAAAAGPSFALADVTLEAPITDLRKFLAIGMNYQAHADEAAAAGHPVPISQLRSRRSTASIYPLRSPRAARTWWTMRLNWAR